MSQIARFMGFTAFGSAHLLIRDIRQMNRRGCMASSLRMERESALITGSSSGVGAAFARQLAERGFDLILTARRQDRLREVADDVERHFGVRVEVLPGDLTDCSHLLALERRIREESPSILINNAGFGVSGRYVEVPVERHLRMVEVHITAMVRLTHAVLPGMIQRGKGHIVNVSSIAAFIPAGGGPGYSASKAYMNTFSSNLQANLHGTGVAVQALCPGYTYTEFHSTEEYQGKEREEIPSWLWMEAEQVVRCSLQRLDRGRVIVIPGMKNRVIAFLLRSRWAEKMLTMRNRWLKRVDRPQ